MLIGRGVRVACPSFWPLHRGATTDVVFQILHGMCSRGSAQVRCHFGQASKPCTLRLAGGEPDGNHLRRILTTEKILAAQSFAHRYPQASQRASPGKVYVVVLFATTSFARFGYLLGVAPKSPVPHYSLIFAPRFFPSNHSFSCQRPIRTSM